MQIPTINIATKGETYYKKTNKLTWRQKKQKSSGDRKRAIQIMKDTIRTF